MLVALAVTLVMMAAVVNLFANISGSIRNRRAAIETGAQLRQVRQRLAMDLNGATSRGTTWQRPEANQGYIEIIEGEFSDKDPSAQVRFANLNTPNGIDTTISAIPSSQALDPETGDVAGPTGVINIGAGSITDGRALGDWDDVLALTVKSESDPFTARYGAAFVESPLAEVVWLATEQGPSATPNPNDGMRRIYRRVLLIAPWLDAVGTVIGDPPTNISAHWDPSRACWVANTLGDLTKRENRATRRGNSLFPHVYDPHSTPPSVSPASVDYRQILPGNTPIDALVLNNALAFDIRVFDPGAPLYADASGAVLEPVDLGWGALAGGTPTGFGAYCDLGWNWNQTAPGPALTPYFDPAGVPPIPQFGWPRQAGSHPTPLLTNPRAMLGYPAVYDTWSYHYENDGLDQEQRLLDWFGTFTTPPPNLPQFLTWQLNNFDQGANGLDDDGANGVDDRGERETSPPYDVPLRGIKVILRVYEPDARQIRESSVTHSFRQ